jgi:hypothetical protein
MTEESLPEKSNKHLDKIIFISLLVLSMAGVGITDYSPEISHFYWLAMVFVFAIAAMFSGYKRAQHKNLPVWNDIFIHLLHWVGTLIAVLVVYTFLHTGRIDFEQTGLMILLILALATFLDGLRIGWRFSLAGVFLGVTAIVAAYVEEFMLIIFFFAVVIMALGFFWVKHKS